ncbi:hypothetical protein D3C72_1858430 [compost metagenome]
MAWVAGSGGICALDSPSTCSIRLRVSESPVWAPLGSGLQDSVRIRLRAGNQGASAGYSAGLGLTVSGIRGEFTRESLPGLGPNGW